MWQILSYVLMGVLVIVAVVGFVLFRILRPIAVDYVKTRNKPGKTFLVVCQRNGTMMTVAANYVAGVHERITNNERWAFFSSRGRYRFGEASAEFVYDGSDMATDPATLVAVAELKARGYHSIEDVMRAVRAGEFGGDYLKTIDGVVHFADGTICVPLIAAFDPASIEGYSRGKPAITRAYTDTALNIDRARRDGKFYENPQVMAIGFILIAGCIGIGIMKSMGVF